MSESGSAGQPLRTGWTTGTCATAAAAAAYEALLTGSFPDEVTVALPRGSQAVLPISRAELRAGAATAGVIKDAGDDPDVTHGALVLATVEPGPPHAGIAFRAGPGVGTVTLPGLPLAPGEPAINPGPRSMITRAIAAVAACHGGSGDVVVTIAIPDGVRLAEKTLNGRLGICGGLSILGTTGIVVPFSCAAWIHSIHRGIDVARAMRLDHLAAATGSTSEAAVKRMLDLPDAALIDMGDFAGGTLKYLRAHPVPRLTLAGGFGKLAKLAQGHLFLHSKKSQVDVSALAGLLEQLGAPAADCAAARRAHTAAQVLVIARAHGLPLADRVAAQARETARSMLGAQTAVQVLVFDRAGILIGKAQEQQECSL